MTNWMRLFKYERNIRFMYASDMELMDLVQELLGYEPKEDPFDGKYTDSMDLLDAGLKAGLLTQQEYYRIMGILAREELG